MIFCPPGLRNSPWPPGAEAIHCNLRWKLQSKHPGNIQTGPAIRDDQETIERHRSELKESAEQLKLYNYITKHIKRYHENR